MLGLKGIRKEIDFLVDNVAMGTQLGTIRLDLSAQWSTYQTLMRELNIQLVESKSALSSIKASINDLSIKIVPYKETFDSLLIYTNLVDNLTDQLEANNEKLANMQYSLNHLIRQQEHIFKFLEAQEKINDDIQMIIDNYAPVKKVPKLPKKTPATSAAS